MKNVTDHMSNYREFSDGFTICLSPITLSSNYFSVNMQKEPPVMYQAQGHWHAAFDEVEMHMFRYAARTVSQSVLAVICENQTL